jgi:hypothetical protein
MCIHDLCSALVVSHEECGRTAVQNVTMGRGESRKGLEASLDPEVGSDLEYVQLELMAPAR